MKRLDVKYRQNKDYRELFSVTIDAFTCEDTAVGITKDGELLFVKSKLMNQSSAYWVDSEFFGIDTAEFRELLGQAQANGYIGKAIRSGQTTEEELKKLSGNP